jgi:hypothetical protein
VDRATVCWEKSSSGQYFAVAWPLPSVTIPLGQSFLNTSIFDEVDVSLESAGSSFIEITPLVLEGLGTDDWSSIFLTEQHASSSGPAAAGLTAIALNLTAKTDPIKIVVRLRFQGGAIRAVEYFFDGTEWTVTELSLNGSGPGVRMVGLPV